MMMQASKAPAGRAVVIAIVDDGSFPWAGVRYSPYVMTKEEESSFNDLMARENRQWKWRRGRLGRDDYKLVETKVL
jgi:hypothetical protein